MVQHIKDIIIAHLCWKVAAHQSSDILYSSLLDYYFHPPKLCDQEARKHICCFPLERHIPQHHRSQGSLGFNMLSKKKKGDWDKVFEHIE